MLDTLCALCATAFGDAGAFIAPDGQRLCATCTVEAAQEAVDQEARPNEPHCHQCSTILSHSGAWFTHDDEVLCGECEETRIEAMQPLSDDVMDALEDQTWIF